MNVRLSIVLTIIAFAIQGTLSLAAVDAAEDDDGWIEGKLQALSLREKIGQMIMVDVHGTALTPALAEHFWKGAFGGVIFFERNVLDADQTRSFVRGLQDHAVIRSGVPLLVAVDQEGGSVNRLGTMLGLASSTYSARTIGRLYRYDERRAKKTVVGVVDFLAARMRDLGFNMNLAPVLDVTDDERSFIYDRSYGGDPSLVATVTGDIVGALQRHRIAATGKHFPSLSSTRTDSHWGMPVLDRDLDGLKAKELLPFTMLKKRLGAIMVGHVMVPAVDQVYPASLSVRVGDLLRRVVGFDGVVMTDDLKMHAVADRYSLSEMTLRAVAAGADILLVAWGPEKQIEGADFLEQAVQKGWIKTERIDASVRRILRLKRQVGR